MSLLTYAHAFPQKLVRASVANTRIHSKIKIIKIDNLQAARSLITIKHALSMPMNSLHQNTACNCRFLSSIQDVNVRTSNTFTPVRMLYTAKKCNSVLEAYPSRRIDYSKKSEQEDEDTLVYSYYDPKFYKRASAFMVILVLLFGSQCVFSLYDGQNAPVKDIDVPQEERTAIQKFQSFGRRYQWYCLSALYAGMGITTVGVLSFYIRRSVRELWLLNGGEKVRLNIYDLFGSHKDRVVPLEDMSFINTRGVKGSAVMFKLKGVRLQYMLDKNNGKFYDTDLFDYTICMKRNLKKK